MEVVFMGSINHLNRGEDVQHFAIKLEQIRVTVPQFKNQLKLKCY